MGLFLGVAGFFFHFLFEVSEYVEVAKGGFLEGVVDLLDGFLGSAFFLVALFADIAFGNVLVDAGVRDDDFLVLFGEFDYLEVKGLAVFGAALVGLLEVAHRSEAFNAIGQSDGGSLIVH